jgi:hypothetical protein
MRIAVGIVLVMLVNLCSADLQYCSGTIDQIITRNSTTEATQVILSTPNGISGAAQIGDSNGYNDYQKVQVSMIIAAYMSN